MLLKTLTISASLTIVFSSLTGCAASTASDSAAKNGLLGAVTGAGIGTAIGAGLSNGDIAASALLGAGAGLGVGVAGGLAYYYYSNEGQINSNEREILGNHASIQSRQYELDQYRRNLDNEASEIVLDEERRQYQYVGPSLGNPYR
jgi:hypothetical protein